MSRKVRYIDVLSDATGATAERVVRAAMLQFPDEDVSLRLHARVRTKQRAEPILKRVAAEGGLLVFSVVSPELADFILRMTSELKIDAIDVIGAVIGRLERYFSRKPINRPGAHLPLSAEYFRRIEAVNFTVRNDSGGDPRDLLEADIVLVGVSRTSKTPVATLLAQRGLKVANLTIALGVAPPVELDSAPDERVVALTIAVESLCTIRQERLRRLGMPPETRYAVRDHVKREIAYAEEIFGAKPWPVVDITGRSVEDTAGIILERLGGQTGSRPGAVRRLYSE